MTTDELWPRVILHADMDAFFAAVEQLDNPQLRGKPILIGVRGARSVVSTASYEARPFGVGSAMPMVTALRRCPNAIVVRPRMGRYKEVSQVVMGVFREFTDLIEPISVDEAFLDLSESARDWPGPEALGRAIKTRVFEATGGLIVSVGVSTSKYVAKVASDHQKPDGLTVVPGDQVVDFLAPLPVKRLWGAGPKTVERLNALGYETIADIANADPATLSVSLGRQGMHFQKLALGLDDRELVTERTPKSVGCERTLAQDTRSRAQIEPILDGAANELSIRLERRGVFAHGVRVKLKTAKFVLQTRQLVLDSPTRSPDRLRWAAHRLLDDFPDLSVPMRLIGMAGYELVPEDEIRQLELFPA